MRQVKVKCSTLWKVVRFHVLEAACSLIDNHFSEKDGHVIDKLSAGTAHPSIFSSILRKISGQYARPHRTTVSSCKLISSIYV
jgi:hypothetical protein